MAGGSKSGSKPPQTSKPKGDEGVKTRANESVRDETADVSLVASSRSDFAVLLDKITEMSKQLGALDYIKEQFENLSQSMNVHTKNYDEYQKTVKGVIEENQATRLEMAVVMNTLTDLQKENAQLKERVEELEQQTRCKDVEIVGFPETKEENLKTIVKTIGTKIGLQVPPDQIEQVERVPSSSKPRPLLVQFKTKTLKDTFLTSARKARVKAVNVNNTFPDTPIFVNEHLTQERKRLIYEARKKKKELQYQHLWTKAGVIYLKKTDDSQPIRIVAQKDLSKIV